MLTIDNISIVISMSGYKLMMIYSTEQINHLNMHNAIIINMLLIVNNADLSYKSNRPWKTLAILIFIIMTKKNHVSAFMMSYWSMDSTSTFMSRSSVDIDSGSVISM